MAYKFSNEMAINLMNMLGIDPTHVSKVVISLEAGRLPTIDITRHITVNESNQFLCDLKRYNLEAREVKK